MPQRVNGHIFGSAGEPGGNVSEQGGSSGFGRCLSCVAGVPEIPHDYECYGDLTIATAGRRVQSKSGMAGTLPAAFLICISLWYCESVPIAVARGVIRIGGFHRREVL